MIHRLKLMSKHMKLDIYQIVNQRKINWGLYKASKKILKEKENYYPYEIDGLIYKISARYCRRI